MGRTGSKIHPHRLSGHNPPGYSRPPQQAALAPQQPLSGDLSVDLGNLGSDASAHLSAAQAAGVTLRAPFRPDPATPCATIRAGRYKIRIPMGWQASTARTRDGGWGAFVLEANGQDLHVLVERAGRLWELSNLPTEIIDKFISSEFKENPK